MKALGERLWHGTRRGAAALVGVARDYVRIVVGHSEGAGLSTLRSFGAAGPLFWLALALLAVSLPLTAGLALWGSRLPTYTAELWPGEAVQVTLVALWASLLLMACGWSYLLVGASGYGLGTFVLVAAYAGYYALTPGMVSAHTAWFAAVPLWLMINGAWLVGGQSTRWRLPLLLTLCLPLGVLLYPITRLSRWLPATWGMAIPGLVCFAILALPRWRWPMPYRPHLAFAINLALLGTFYSLAILAGPLPEVTSLSFLGLHHLLGALGLFWVWMGLDLFNSAQDLADWATTEAKRLPSGWLTALVPGLLAVMGLVAGLAALPYPLGLAKWLTGSGVGRGVVGFWASRATSFLASEILRYVSIISVGALVGWIILGLSRALNPNRLLRLFSLWALACLVSWAGLSLFYAFLEEEQAAQGFWPVLFYVAGTLWETLKNSADLVAGRQQRLTLFAGFLLCLAGVSLFEISSGYSYFQKELTINTFSGALYLGLPYLLYTQVLQWQRLSPVAPRHLLALFGLGLVSAIPMLAGAPLPLTALVWMVALLVLPWRRGVWDDLLDGLAYGLALGLGLAVFSARPLILPIPAYTPLVYRLSEIQADYAAQVIYPWESRWWLRLLVAAVASAALGYGCGLARRRQGTARIAWLVGATLLCAGLLWLGQALGWFT